MVVLITGLFFAMWRNGGAVGGNSPPPAESSQARTLSDGVDLERRVVDFTAGFDQDGGYRQPTGTERGILSDAVGLLLDHDRQAAAERLADIDYVLRTLTDSGTGRRFAEIADTGGGRTGNRGWGRVYVDLTAPVRWSVQIPHPVADEASEKLGVGVLRGTPGGVMVLAGAHRQAGEGNAADVAHRGDTVFDAVCAELLRRRLPGLQLHGFADSSEPDYDVIVSTGKGDTARPAARDLARALHAHHLDPCRAWIRDCALEGRTNQQGTAAAAAHVPFLHVEFSRSVRTSAERTARAVAAMNPTTAAWNRAPRSTLG
jgi:hypothetical protein